MQAQLISLSQQVETDYVKKEYIGTSECSTSSEPCGKCLNISKGRGSDAYIQTLLNFGDVGLP